jgi:hypothetical protein
MGTSPPSVGSSVGRPQLAPRLGSFLHDRNPAATRTQRAADRVTEGPPFAPPAEWWALIRLVSITAEEVTPLDPFGV